MLGLLGDLPGEELSDACCWGCSGGVSGTLNRNTEEHEFVTDDVLAVYSGLHFIVISCLCAKAICMCARNPPPQPEVPNISCICETFAFVKILAGRCSLL
jgi:hypothetical protein